MTQPNKAEFVLIVGIAAVVSIVIVAIGGLVYLGAVHPPYIPVKASSEAVEPQTTLDNLLDAIEWVESRGDANAVGDNGAAIGSFQIWKIMVDDVNRILGVNHFSYEDRWDRDKSRTMCRIYLKHYCSGRRFEYKARCWNGGPNGYKKESTKPYWLKVKARLEL